MINRRITLFKVLDTPVTAEASALITPLSLFGLAAGLGRGRSWPARLRLGLLMVLAYALSDLAHYGGHLLSARYAGAPVDEIRLAAPMPLTLYHNNNVSPRTHQLRSIGGPAGSALAWLVALLLRPLAPAGTAWRTWLTLVAWRQQPAAPPAVYRQRSFVKMGTGAAGLQRTGGRKNGAGGGDADDDPGAGRRPGPGRRPGLAAYRLAGPP